MGSILRAGCFVCCITDTTTSYECIAVEKKRLMACALKHTQLRWLRAKIYLKGETKACTPLITHLPK